MFAEVSYLAATILAGAYIVIAVAEYVSTNYSKQEVAACLPRLPLWPLVILMPLAYFCKRRLYWLSNDRTHGSKPGVVYPHRDRVLGTDWIVDMTRALQAHKLLPLLESIVKSVGPTFWTHVTGQWLLLTNEPENMKAILSTKFEDWYIGGSRQKSTALTVGPHSIFSVNGREWMQARALARPAFTRNQVADLEILDLHVERLLHRIPKDGSAVELQNLLYLLAMDTSTDFMFGYSTNTLVQPTQETTDFAQAFDHALETASFRSRQGTWLSFLIPDKEFDRSIATVHQFIDRYVARAVGDFETKQRPYVFLNELLNTGVPMEAIRDHLLSIIIGGRDTTAGTMSSMFWILSRRPDVVAKAREEISVLNGEKPTWGDLKGFKYLNNILKETLRLFPPVATNMRCAAKDTVLPKGGGEDGQSPLFVPKNTSVRYSLYSLHRRKDVFGHDAEEFRPERWETLRTTYEYIPFSGGPRTCIGQQFALTQMSYLLARVLQTFESIKPGDDLPMLQKICMTTSLANGCVLRFGEPQPSSVS